MGEWTYKSRFRWVVSLSLRPLCPRRKSPQYPFDRKLAGPWNRCERCGEEKICSPCRESNTICPVAKPLVSRYADWIVPAPVWYTLRQTNLVTNSVSLNWLNDRTGRPGRWNLFFQRNVRNVSGVNSGLCVMGTGNAFPGGKSGRTLIFTYWLCRC